MNEASLSDTIYFIPGVKAHKPCAVRVLSILSMAIRRNGRKWFVRFHNFNSNSENYINPVDGIKTNLTPACQSPTCEGRSRVLARLKHAKKKSRKNGLTKRRRLKMSFFWFLKVTVYLWSRYLKDLWTERSGKWGLRILKENSCRTALDCRWFVQSNYESHGIPNDFIELPSCAESKV